MSDTFGNAQPNGAAGAPQPAPGSTSLDLDFTGAETVDIPPPNGEYDFTILAAEHKMSTKEGSRATYLNCQFQLDTEPARGRQVYDMLLTSYKDGTVVGTPAAAAQGLSRGNTALGLTKALKLPNNTLRTLGPIAELIGQQLRGKFRAEKDEQSDEMRLRLRKVVGPATGQGFVPKASAKPAAETFA